MTFSPRRPSRPGSRPFNGPRRPFNRSRPSHRAKAFFDISKFVNKAVATEKHEVFVPKHTFADFGLHSLVLKNLTEKGFVTPSPIQDGAIPHVLKGEDIVGIANTGTGKTAAFLLPVLDKIVRNPKERVLIVAPVRELAEQIAAELRMFAKGSGLFSTVLIGGAPMGPQMRDLRRFNQFIIGTPGRIKDHLDAGRLDLSDFKTVVLDEADRMLDMGFIGDMRILMSRMGQGRQTLFFSATLSPQIEKLIHDFLKNPARVSVKTRDTSKNIDQDVVRVGGRDKFVVLRDLLVTEGFNKTLVFSRTKHGADKLAKALAQAGIPADAIHGNKGQSARSRTLEQFKRDSLKVLVATDVAARGLDISNISHVINYDLPATYEDYVHRIGRTGRADSKGRALTFVD